MPMYDFECGCGFADDSFEPAGTSEIDCPKCGGKMKQVWRTVRVNVGHGTLGRGGRVPDVDPGRVFTMLKEDEKRREKMGLPA